MPDFLRKMDPKQRRLVLAGLAGSAIALVVIIMRGRGGQGGSDGGSGDTGTDPQSPAASGGAVAADGPAGSSTFADNGAALGELNTTLTGIAARLDAIEPGVPTGGADAVAPEEQGSPSAPAAAVAAAPAATRSSTPARSVGSARSGAGVGGRRMVYGKPKINYQGGEHHGEVYREANQNGRHLHVYESGRVVVVGKAPATSKTQKPTNHPKPAPKPAPAHGRKPSPPKRGRR